MKSALKNITEEENEGAEISFHNGLCYTRFGTRRFCVPSEPVTEKIVPWRYYINFTQNYVCEVSQSGINTLFKRLIAASCAP